MNKTTDEKMKELEQRIHRLQGEKRKLMREKKNSERKQRDHAMIVIGAHLLTHFPDETKARLIESTDEEIRAWVDGLFAKS